MASESAPRKRGRPPGQTKAAGAAVSPGRPLATRPAGHAERLAHWRAWWVSRHKLQPSAYELAGRMQVTPRLVQLYAKSAGGRLPTEVALCNLESLCGAYGYEPLTPDHQFL